MTQKDPIMIILDQIQKENKVQGDELKEISKTIHEIQVQHAKFDGMVKGVLWVVGMVSTLVTIAVVWMITTVIDYQEFKSSWELSVKDIIRQEYEIVNED